MINPLKDKGIRSFLLKTTIVLGVGLAVSMAIKLYFINTIFFNKYLDIPQAFYLEAGNIRTIFINALLFGIVAFLIVGYKNNKLQKIKYFKFKPNQLIFILLSGFFLFFQYYYKYLINKDTEYFLQAPTSWGILKIVINMLFIISLAIGIYGLNFTKYFFKDYRKEVIIFSTVSVGFFFLMLVVQNLWSLFSKAVTSILYWVFSLFFDNVIYKPYVVSFSMKEGGGPLLGIGDFSAIVGKPCSGIDSFLLFTALYMLIFILDYHKLNRPKSIIFYFIGIIGMFITNVIRVFLLYIVGAFIDKDFAVGLFHTNVGWILFIGYFFIYWWLISKYIYPKTLVKSINK